MFSLFLQVKKSNSRFESLENRLVQCWISRYSQWTVRWIFVSSKFNDVNRNVYLSFVVEQVERRKNSRSSCRIEFYRKTSRTTVDKRRNRNFLRILSSLFKFILFVERWPRVDGENFLRLSEQHENFQEIFLNAKRNIYFTNFDDFVRRRRTKQFHFRSGSHWKNPENSDEIVVESKRWIHWNFFETHLCCVVSKSIVEPKFSRFFRWRNKRKFLWSCGKFLNENSSIWNDFTLRIEILRQFMQVPCSIGRRSFHFDFIFDNVDSFMHKTVDRFSINRNSFGIVENIEWFTRWK